MEGRRKFLSIQYFTDNKFLTYVFHDLLEILMIPYGGKIWRGKTLANDHKFAKFEPSKFNFLNTSRIAEAQAASYVYR